jgi:uncharacterized membrane protein
VFAIAALPAIAPQPAFAQCSYSAVVIEGPPCPFAGQAALIGRGLDSHGDVVGFWMDCDVTTNHAFHWSAKTGVLTTLLRPPGVYDTRAEDITDDGLIIGTHSTTGLGNRGFVYDINNPDAGFTYLEPLHGVGGSSLSAINNSGIAVGSRSIGKPGQSPNPFNAVIWNTKTGEVIDLGVMNGPNSWATAIRDNGDIVGNTGNSSQPQFLRAWSFLDGLLDVLPPIPKGTSSYAAGIDASRTVVGGGVSGTEWSSPGIWENGAWFLLPLPSGIIKGGLAGCNDLGQRVGRVLYPGSPTIERAAIWQHNHVFELGDLMVDPPGTVVFHRGIQANNAGEVLARGLMNGRTVAFVLAPVGDIVKS